MPAFLLILNRLFPLYLLVLAGFLAGRYFEVRKETVAKLLIYVLSPVIVFYGVLTAPLSRGTALLPVMFFILCCLICLIFFSIGRYTWRGKDPPLAHLTGFATGDANTGYFGLPVAIALFGEASMSLVIISAFGFILYENTLGFFITARGHHTARESLDRVLRLPSVYAFVLGLIANLMHLRVLPIYEELIRNIRGAYSVLGMMMIGLGVATLESLKFDFKFIFLCLFAKFTVWPALVFGIIHLDSRMLHLFDPSAYRVMALLACVPLAANTVAIATELRVAPEKAGIVVLLSTLVALFFIPYMAGNWIPV